MTNEMDELAGQMRVKVKMIYCQYNRDNKVIRMVFETKEGEKVKEELPATSFKFHPGMDVDEEMEKTAELMRRKCLNKFGQELVSTARPTLSGFPGIQGI